MPGMAAAAAIVIVWAVARDQIVGAERLVLAIRTLLNQDNDER